MITNDVRRAKLAKIPEPMQLLYGSDAVTKTVKETKTEVPVEKTPLFVQIVGDVILGFYRTTEMPGLLQTQVGVSADTAQRIVARFTEVFSPVLEREAAEVGIKKEVQQNLATKIESAHEDRGAANPVQTHDIEPMHTMESDGNRIHGYGAYREKHRYGEEPDKIVQSSQDEILNKGT